MFYLIAVLGFALMIFVHELGHFLAAKAANVKVHEFAIGMGPALLRWGKGETKYSIRIFPFGGYVKLEGEDEESEDDRSLSKRPPLVRIGVMVAGAFMNVLLGILIFVILAYCRQLAVPIVSYVVPNSAAESVGIQVGDEIVRINDTVVHTQYDVQFYLSQIKNENATVTVKRGGDFLTYSLKLTKDESGNYKIGFRGSAVERKFTKIISCAFYHSIFMVKLVFVSLYWLITGVVSVREVSGPVGIVGVIGQVTAAEPDFLIALFDVLTLFAMITINLGVFNLLPFPALDGGKVVFALFELIFRKPVSVKIESLIHAIGLIILLILSVLVMISDVFKLIY